MQDDLTQLSNGQLAARMFLLMAEEAYVEGGSGENKDEALSEVKRKIAEVEADAKRRGLPA